jgi:hypothetical protein
MIERRSRERFELVEVAHYSSLARRSESIQGVGQTVNISSSGMLLRAAHEFGVGDRVRVAVHLILLNMDASVQLGILGRVVRVEQECIAIKFDEQHLCRTSVQNEPAHSPVSSLDEGSFPERLETASN